MTLTVKEKEKYVLKLREEGKTYRDIAHELLISPREISRILKEANGKNEKKERIYQIQLRHCNFLKVERVRQKWP